MDFLDGMVDLKIGKKWPFWPRSEADFGFTERVQLAGLDGTKMDPFWSRFSRVWPISGVPFWLEIGHNGPKCAISTLKMRQLDQNERFCVENRALTERTEGLGCQVAHWVRRTHDAAACVGNYLSPGDSGRFVRLGERVPLSENT